MKFKLKILLIVSMLCFISTFQEGCNNKSKSETKNKIKKTETTKNDNYTLTFIDLGSVKCIACKMMEPVMEKIREKYKGKVKVLFYDVWTEEGKPYAYLYKIKVIPTQIILDKNGNELFRHQGYIPFEEVEKIFRKYGVK